MYINIKPEHFLKRSESTKMPSEFNLISAYSIHLLDMDFSYFVRKMGSHYEQANI